MGLWNYYIRWRHSKGFGVHSPYAYRFVTEVLRPGPYGRYCYWDIEDKLEGRERNDYKFIKLIKFIIRLALFLNSKRIISSPDLRISEIIAGILKIPIFNCVDNISKFSSKDLLIFEGSMDIYVLKEIIESGAAVLAIRPADSIRSLLDKPISKGLLLKDSQILILISRPEMEYISYDISLSPR